MTLIIEWLPCDQYDQQSITINSRLTKLITSWLYLHTQLTHLRSNSKRVSWSAELIFLPQTVPMTSESLLTPTFEMQTLLSGWNDTNSAGQQLILDTSFLAAHILLPSLPPLWLPSHNRKPISKTGVLKYGLFPHALWCMGKRKSWLACDGPTIILCLI